MWSTRVDHMCVIWPNTFWGLVSIYLKSLPPKYHVQKCKTHHGGVEKTIFLSLHGVDGITTFIFSFSTSTGSMAYIRYMNLPGVFINIAMFLLENFHNNYHKIVLKTSSVKKHLKSLWKHVFWKVRTQTEFGVKHGITSFHLELFFSWGYQLLFLYS